MLAAGSDYVYALTSAGTVWGWGNSSVYTIPNAGGGTTARAVLTGLTNVSSIATTYGRNYGMALKTDGSVVVWGGGYSTVTPVSGLSGVKVIAGGTSNYAITEDGKVWNWEGANIPVQVPGLSDVSAVAGGKDYAVASKTDGSVWAWGSSNYAGQLGDGTTTVHSTPALVNSNTAQKVILTYPLGSKEAPEESNVSNPLIRWTHSDAALTRFAAFQVQVMDASGAIVVDSGTVSQPMTTTTNDWTLSKGLVSGQIYQVKVKVYDEHFWSEWSSVGWIEINNMMLKTKKGINSFVEINQLLKLANLRLLN